MSESEDASSGFRIALMGGLGVVIGAIATLGLAIAFVPSLTAGAAPRSEAEGSAPTPTASALAPTGGGVTAAPPARAAAVAPATAAATVAQPAPAASAALSGRLPVLGAHSSTVAGAHEHVPQDHDARDPYRPQTADAPLAKDVYEGTP